MLSYALNTSPTSYSGGGVIPNNYQPVQTLESNFYNTLDSTLESMGVVGDFVDGALGFFGWKPEDWESVKLRADAGVERMINYAIELMTSIPNAQTMTIADKYLALEIARLNYFKAKYKSSNSINSINVQIDGLEVFRSKILSSSGNLFTYSLVTSSNTEGLKSLGQNAFPVSNVSHYKFLDKIANSPVQTVDLSGNPVQTVGGNTDIDADIIPTNTGGASTTEKPFNWLFVIIPVGAVALWKLGEWLIKKFKK